MTKEFSAGDFVRFRLADRELDATVLESPDSSVVLVKLSSGYNIGIPRDNILASRILKRYETEERKFEIPFDSSLPSIGMIVTGGTIASKLDPKTGGVKHLTDIGEFARFYPELFKSVNVKKIEAPFMLASESMGPEQWIAIAESAKKLLDDPEIKGVVVTHGTDFLHYTSAALSFFLRGLGKPVVLTYSQRSIDRGSSDANLNLQCAARMAIDKAAGVFLGRTCVD
jgi:glutamyl-tRNA(Gln) amidotransferase subunit D